MTEADFWEGVFYSIRDRLKRYGPLTWGEYQELKDDITKYLKRYRREK